MERFAKIVNGFKPLTIFAKRSILDVWQDTKSISKRKKSLKKPIHSLLLQKGSFIDIWQSPRYVPGCNIMSPTKKASKTAFELIV